MSAQVPRSIQQLQQLNNQRLALQRARIQSMMTATVVAAGGAGFASQLTMMPMVLPMAALPDHSQPTTLGWRAWYWITPPLQMKPRLISPHMHTEWPTPELHVEAPWDDSDVLRGASGIHARLMPRDWRRAGWPQLQQQEGPMDDHPYLVTGVVERFGRFVLGRTGWRAEWVMIRALMAKTTDTGLALEMKFPDIPVYYRDKEENDGHR